MTPQRVKQPLFRVSSEIRLPFQRRAAGYGALQPMQTAGGVRLQRQARERGGQPPTPGTSSSQETQATCSLCSKETLSPPQGTLRGEKAKCCSAKPRRRRS